MVYTTTYTTNQAHKPTLLFYALEKLNYVKLLLKAGVDVHVRNDEQQSALDLDLNAGNAQLFELLCKAGSIVDYKVASHII